MFLITKTKIVTLFYFQTLIKNEYLYMYIYILLILFIYF